LSKHAMSTFAAIFSCPGYSAVIPRPLSRCSATTIQKIMTAGTPAGIDMAMALRNLKKAVLWRRPSLPFIVTVEMYMRKLSMKAKM